MGILDIAEEAAGAFGADKALEAVDPNAGFLAKAVAAVAGFEGVSKIKDMMAGSDAPAGDQAEQDQDDDGSATASADGDSDQN